MEVEELLGRLKNLSRVKKVADKAENLAQFGLDQPELSIRYRTPSGWRELLLGAKSPVGQEIYAKVGDNDEVFLVAAMDKNVLGKSLFDLREKRLFPFGTDEVDAVEWKNGNLHVALSRDEDGRWVLKGNEDFKVDRKRVDEVVRNFCWARVREFVQEDDVALDKYGLVEPSAEATLAKGGNSQTLYLGAKTKDGKVYAKLKGRLGVVALEDRVIADLPASLSDIEDRSILSLDEDQVGGLSWKRGDEEYVLKKSKEDFRWAFERPEKLKKKALESWKADAVVSSLVRLERLEEPDSVPEDLREPRLELTVSDKDNNSLVSLIFGKSGDESEIVSVGIRTGDTIRPFLVSGEKVREVEAKLKDLEGDAS